VAGKGLRLGIGWRLGIIVVAAVERLGIGGAVPAGPHPSLRMHPITRRSFARLAVWWRARREMGVRRARLTADLGR